MTDEVGKVAISVDASGVEAGLHQAERTVSGFAAVEQGITASFEGIGGAAERQAVKVVESMARQVRAIDGMQRRYDPIGAQLRAIEKDIERLDAAIAKGGPESVRAIDLKIRAMAQFNEVSNRTANEAIAAAEAESRVLDAAAQKVRDQVNPIAAAYRAQGEEITRLQGLRQAQKITEVELAAATTAVTSATAAQVAVLDGSAAAARAAAKADADLTAQARQFIAVADPAAASQAQFAEKTAIANQLLAAGKISAAQHSAGLAVLREEHVRAAAGVSQTSGVMRQFGVQSIDVFQQLASGAPIMTTLIQQGGQMAQVVGSTGGAMGMLRAAAAAVASPIGVATGAVAAFAVVSGLALSKASTLADETKALSVGIAAVGRSAELSAGQLQTYVSALARQGVKREDANAIVGQLSRTTLTQPQIQQVTSLVPDTAAALGVDAKQAAQQLAEAANGSYEAIKRLDGALNILTATQREAIRTMLEHGDKAGAVGLAFDALRGRVKGLEEQGLSEFSKAIRGVGNAWDDLVTKIANTGPILGALDVLKKSAQGWAFILSGGADTREFSQRIVSLNQEVLTLEDSIAKLGEPRTAAREELLNRQKQRLAELKAEMDSLIAKAQAGQTAPTASGPLPALPSAIVGGGQSATELDRQLKANEDFTKSIREQDEVLRASLPTREAVRARQAAINEGVRLGITGTELAARGQLAYDAAMRAASDAATQNAAAVQRATEAGLAQAVAADNGRAAMLRAAAAAEAHEAAATQAGVAEDELTQAILDRNAAQEATRAAGAIVDLRDQVAASDALAKATSQTALWYAELDNEVKAATKSLQAYMDVATDPELKKRLAGQIQDITIATGQNKEARGAGDVNRATIEANAAADAQMRVLAAYDGTTQSLVRARNEQTAYGLALQKMRPDQEGFADTVARYAEALNRSSAATAQLQQAEESVQAVTDTLGTAFDRVGQGLVDAALTGQNALVSLANIGKAVASSILADFAKLSIANPFKNWALGTTSPTLGGAFGTFLGGGGSTLDSARNAGGGGLMDNASNFLTLGSLGDKLGLTNIGGQFSSFGETIGLTGNGGLLSNLGLSGNGGMFSGIGSGINSVLSTPLWSTGLGGVPLEGAYSAAQVAASGTTTTLGGLLGGVGAGYGVGSLAGGFLQNSLGKVGPAPQIGAGVGAMAGAAIGSIIPGIGTLIGGLIGGLVGGGGGGLIGPKAASPFSSTSVSLENGQLVLGQTIGQIVDTAQEVANATQQLAQINTFLSQSGITIQSLGALTQIGQNSPKGTPDPSKFADLASGFSGFKFTSADPVMAKALDDQSFGDLSGLQAAVTAVKTFVDQTVPALKALGNVDSFGAGALAESVKALSAQFDGAIEQAKKLGYAEGDLTDARDRAIQAANDNAAKQAADIDASLNIRAASAAGQLSGDPADQMKAALMAFDQQAEQQRTALRTQLLGLFGDAYGSTQAYADKQKRLEEVLGQERLAVAKQFNDQMVAQYEAARAEIDRAWRALASAREATETSLPFRTAAANRAIAGTVDPIGSSAIADYQAKAAQELVDYREQLNTRFGNANRPEVYEAEMAKLRAVQAKEAAALAADQTRQMQAARGQLDDGLRTRWFAAQTNLADSPEAKQGAALQAFDYRAGQEVVQFKAQLVAIYGSAITETQGFVDTVANLEGVLADERLAIVRDYARQAAEIERQNENNGRALIVRKAVADAALSGDPTQIRDAADQGFMERARQERDAAIRDLVATYGEGIRETQGFADRLVQIDGVLYAERLALQKQYADQAAAQERARVDQMQSLVIRQATAEAAVSGDPAGIQAAALRAFDEQSRLERQATDQGLVSNFGEGVRQTQRYVDTMTQLDKTLYAERLALQKQYADQSLEAQRSAAQTAGGIVTSMTEYVRGLQTGPNSALSTQAKYDLASRQFEVTRAAAVGGDLRALQNLTSYADTLVTASRGMFGSGVGYVQDIDRIVDAISQIALQPPEVLSNLVFVAEMRAQTQTVVQELGDRLDVLIDEIAALRRGQIHADGAPPTSRAA